MADPRYTGGEFKNTAAIRRQAAITNRINFERSTPAGNGWEKLYDHPQTGWPVYELNGYKLMFSDPDSAWCVQDPDAERSTLCRGYTVQDITRLVNNGFQFRLHETTPE